MVFCSNHNVGSLHREMPLYMTNPSLHPSTSLVFIPIVFQLQYRSLLFFLAAICVDAPRVIGCKSPWLDPVSCSPGSCSQVAAKVQSAPTIVAQIVESVRD